jgi:hypothetical protein
MSEMNQSLLFMGICFCLGLGMVFWKVVISEVIRDRKVFKLAEQARKLGEPAEVVVKLIPIKRKCGYVPDGLHFDIESNGQHWYFTSWKLLWRLPKDGERGMMYVLPSEDFNACYIELTSGNFLGALSEELPNETGVKTDIQSLKDDEWRSLYS